MKKAVFINFIPPVVYIMLIVLLRLGYLTSNSRVFIAEYASGLLVLQAIACITGIVICKNLKYSILFLILAIMFAVFLFRTAEGFNPV